MYSLLRRLLFLLPAEPAANIAIGGLSITSRHSSLCRVVDQFNRRQLPALPKQVMGITFPNPIGLAAGLDKQATAVNAMHALGFGWVELGTVTLLPQPGNPKPRLFRLSSEEAIINRMGFNSVGVTQFVRNLKNSSNCSSAANPSCIQGISIGKNTRTDSHDVLRDYLLSLEAVYEVADYVAINISCPNLPNMPDLHEDKDNALDSLLGGIHHKRMQLADKSGRRVPLVLKVSPDMTEKQIDHIADLARKHCMDGIAACNTTTTRVGIENHPRATKAGGLSGAPLATLATETIAQLQCNLQGQIPIIGCGGIHSAEDAVEKFQAGAELVQLYTGFIYHGPKLIREILHRIHNENTAETSDTDTNDAKQRVNMGLSS